jgi:hypothetical protein
MSNDYFKAQGWFKNYALNSQDSRGVFQQLVKEDEEAFRLASAETDKIKEEMNKKFGSGTVKYGSEIKQPEIKTPQAIFEFSQRNPAAEGGRMRFYEGMSADKAKKKIKLKKPVTLTGMAGDRKLTADQINALDSNYLGNFEGGDLERPKKVYKSGTPGSVLDDAIEIRNIIVKNKGNIFGLEELGEMAEIFGEGSRQGKKGNRPDIRRVRAALEVAKDNFPEIGNFKFVTDRYKIDGSQRKQLNMVVDTIKNYQNSKGGDKLANFLPENMGMLYKSLRETNPEKGLYIKMYNFGPEQIKYITDRITNETDQVFKADDYKNLIKEVKDFRASISSDARQASRAVKMNADIKKLYDDKVIQKLITGDLNNKSKKKILERAVDILDDDIAVASRRLFMMAQSIAGTRPIEGINVDEDLGKKIIDTQRIIGKAGNNYAFSSLVYDHYGKTIDNALNSPKGKSFIGYYQQKIKNALDKGLVPDEIFSVTASARRGMSPYAIFTQALDAEVNSAIKGANLDSLLSKTHRDLQNIFKGRKYNQLNAKDKKAVNDLVEIFDNAKKDVLKNLKPEIRNTIQLAEFDLKNPPSKSIANYNSYDKNLQLAFDKSFKDTGYSMKVPKEFKTQKELLTQLESYITDRTGKVKQPMFSSGLSGAYEMLSDDLKKIINSEGFKTFKAKIANPALKTAVGAAKLPTKIFGSADLVLGYLDYTNNRQKGFSKEDSTRHMVDAVLFGATSFGEKGDIEGVKKIAMQNGMSEEIFNNLVNINTNQKAMINRINESKAKFNESMDIIESGTADPVTEKMLIQKLKVDTKKFLTNTMKNIVDDSRSLNTNLQVQEAGAPININVDKQQQKAFSDLGSASRKFVQNRIDASDPKVFEQGDTTMGKIGSTIKETIMQPDFYTGFFKQTKAQKDREDMEKLKIQDPTMYYKMLMSEGVDPRIKLNIPVQLEFEQKYPQFGTQYSDSLTQNKAEGGITTLRSKYEYKK